jgi:predicted exporter
VIGIGVDNGVYVMHRYRMEGRSSLRRIVRNLGRAMTASVLTNICGFGALLFSHHPGLRSLGLVTVIGLSSTFLAAIFFLPSLLFVYETLAARINLGRRAAATLWTVAHDPATARILALLRARGADFKIVVLDELPASDRKAQVDRLRTLARGVLDLPMLEVGGKVASASSGTSQINHLLDNISA